MISPTAALALCRLGRDAAALGLWGAWACLAWIVPPGLAAALDRGARRPTIAAAAVAAVATAAELPVLGAFIGEGWRDAFDPALLAGVLAETSSGHAWAAQAVTVALLLAALAAPRRIRPVATASAAAALLATLALTGHAASGGGTSGALRRGNDVLHVLSAGAWLGALLPVLAILRRLDRPQGRADAATALRRFSRAGHAAVALVLLSGVVNAELVLRRWPTDLGSPYEALLDAKVAAVCAMVALALLNRYALVPRLGRAPDAALAGLRRATLAELALGLAAVALVAVFGLLDPN